MVFSMISNLATLALALTIRAKPFDMDIVFWSERGCNGSFKSYLVNVATDPCTAPCLDLKNVYGDALIYDPSHNTSCQYYQSNDCSGNLTYTINNSLFYLPNPSCNAVFDENTGDDILHQRSVRCYRSQPECHY